MSMTITTTSPLRSAREWRGISLAHAARSSGLSMSRAEALEEGRIEEFSSIDEMVATTILFGAWLGIGRDEALALLDRTLEQVVDPITPQDPGETPLPGPTTFSQAVRQRSEVLAAERSDGVTLFAKVETVPLPEPPATPDGGYSDLSIPMVGGQTLMARSVEETGPIPIITSPTDPSGDLDVIRNAVSVDPAYRAALEQSAVELQRWNHEHDQMQGRRHPYVNVLVAKVTALVDRFGGTNRMKHLNTRSAALAQDGREFAQVARARLRRSEHATLVVAIGVGMVMIALLVAIASLAGGGTSQTKSRLTAPPVGQSWLTSHRAQVTALRATATARGAAGKTVQLPRAAFTVVVLNAGHTRGKAGTMSARLRHLGYSIDEIGNSHTSYRMPIILYSPQHRAEASRLSKDTGITTLDVQSRSASPLGMTIVVV